jgi:hypothetical protein
MERDIYAAALHIRYPPGETGLTLAAVGQNGLSNFRTAEASTILQTSRGQI